MFYFLILNYYNILIKSKEFMINSKKLSKEEFIVLFQFAFDTNINKVLQTRTKVGIGGGSDFSDFYDQIVKILNQKNYSNIQPKNELNCILKFFDDKCYEKIKFPKDYEMIFSLIKFCQKGYNSNTNIKKMTDYLNNVLGEDLFLQTALCYFEKNPIQNENIKDIFFSVFRFDYIHNHFVANVFNLIYKKHQEMEKDELKQKIANVVADRLTSNSSLSFYKKLEKMDKYIGTSNFADQFYDYNLQNKKFIDKVKLYKIECEYNNLNKELDSKIKIEPKKVMKL